MNETQRRVTLAVSVIVGLTFLVSAGLTFLVAPMSGDLSLDQFEIETLLAIPSIASLLVIFIAGQVGEQLGSRRTLLIASLGFTLGGLILASSHTPFQVNLGLALCGATATAIQIVAVGLLQKSVPAGPAHVSAFTTFGMVYPLAFLLFPLATATTLGAVPWRWIPVAWALAGLGITALTLALLPRGEQAKPLGEWLTPLLAGIALAGTSRFIIDIGHEDALEPRHILGLIGGIVAAITCALMVRSRAGVSFTLAPIRTVVVRGLLLAVAVSALIGTLTYVTLAVEYMYDLTALQAALAVAPAQAGAIIGAKVIARKAMARFGVGPAGRGLMLGLAASMLPLIFTSAQSPLWFIIVCATAFNTMAMAAVTTFNTDVMARSPEGQANRMSSFRGAASSLGSAFGVLILGTSIISATRTQTGISGATAEQLEAIAAGLRINGVLGCLVALAGWTVLTLVTRRQPATSAHP